MPGTNLIVFRDNKKLISKHCVALDLERTVERIRANDRTAILDCLILAGQLESALWDGRFQVAQVSFLLTDAVARHAVGIASQFEIDSRLGELLPALPDWLSISEPEGFSYYALHPLDFADVTESIAGGHSLALIGIRSIGTTLSAVAMAQLQKSHVCASRITVRPTGHPYDRKTEFTPRQIEWIKQEVANGSTFLVLDEGPGLSGSSFLSVAESLVDQSVAPDRIILIGTRECDPAQLCAADAQKRWARFRWHRVGSRINKRFADQTPLSGGMWRGRLLESDAGWPPSWKAMESLRFLAADQEHIFKFQGLAAAGIARYERAQAIHGGGFGPALEQIGDGMHSYTFVRGKVLSGSAISSDLLDRIARYCSFRVTEFSVSHSDSSQLEEMARFNFLQQTGSTLSLPDGCLEAEAPVIPDGRMQLHKWVLSNSGITLKVDAVQHGDDHFLPGPADIAWDLAGVIVEWDLSVDAAEYLLRKFFSYSGIDRFKRLPQFALGYSIFRLAYCKMAFAAIEELDEKNRFRKACTFYRRKLDAFLPSFRYIKISSD
jgi:hypothetical protein